MIFKHLFTPKWKHPKQQVRLEAIEKLDVERDATILSSLALDDNSAEIRKKALNKVDNLVLWWKAYKQDQSLKDLAEQHISNAVLNNEQSLTSDIKNEYIERFAPVKTLEKLAFAEKELQVRVKLLKRLSNPKLTEKAFKEGASELQQQLVELVINQQLAKNLVKHAQGEVKTILQTHLDNERLAVEMPVQVHNETRVILAKLNALRDKQDYEQVNQQNQLLVAQWQAIELKWLNAEQVAVLDEKYQSITAKLDAHLAQLNTQYEQQKALLIQQQHEVLALANLEALSEEIENALQLGLETPEQIQQDWLDAKVEQAQVAIAQSELGNSEQKTQIVGKLTQLFKQVAQLPQLTQAISDFKLAFDALNAIPTEVDKSTFDQLNSDFDNAFKAANTPLKQLPASLQGPFKAQLKAKKQAWQEAVAPLSTQLTKSQQQASRKGRDVKRLIEQGRFNVAFGVFKGFIELYDTLTPAFAQQLDKLKDELEQQLADARDWQKYASAPKREELLAEITAQLEQPCTDAKARANEVKTLRRRWNELGRLDTEQEQLQGKEFDEKIELLFAPCREHFAQLEQQREQIKQQREAVIVQMQALAQTDTSIDGFEWKDYESQYNRINKAWRNAGNVEPKVYRALQQQYKPHQQAVFNALNAFHKANSAAKNALVEQAQQLSQSDDLASACQQLKELQQQWQKVGFAGVKAENALWQKFRQLNDLTFAKRSEEFAQHKEQQDADNAIIAQQLTELEDALGAVNQKAQLLDLKTKVTALPNAKELANRVSTLLSNIDAKLAQLTEQAAKADFAALFSALENQQPIPAQWQGNASTALSVAQLLIRMEILANVASPAGSERMAEQVAMLDDKHRGEQADLHFYLKQLLALSEGSVDAETLTRLKTVFSV
ncbi:MULTISPECIES: DUF349 domain-containing protein [unclassified Pseudoalteromonas]|uniref:DUF349 domain-containing protein n=2 Tax=Bacteria TaxID=2 RepID=UPI0025B3720B|nr:MULTISPECIES: DUF349 domain-containing protein [unclassified Pseudoalteromonas]MDN3380201.1 DUF349 domain-containing protein [Pseudoalteromonas sp. APC 3893]MDN3388466.1 DUF349 domain-containing protein [Pseudoalteromonas sp. APC 4017]